jgi:hypothetical protein
MYYLWLVLPFWEKVRISVNKQAEASVFVFRDGKKKGQDKKQEEKKKPEREHEMNKVDSDFEGCSEADSGDELIEWYTRVGPWEKEWNSQRLRKIIQRESMSGMGVKLNISLWRQIIKAISRRYLQYRFEDDEDGGEEMETEAETMDSIWDEQSSHGRLIGDMIYRRLLTEPPREQASRRKKFRYVSQEWHRFLGFMSTMQGVGIRTGSKRARSFYNDAA